MGRCYPADRGLLRYVLSPHRVTGSSEFVIDVFDGLMVALAMLSLAFFNPGVLLYGSAALRRKVEFADVREKA